MNKMMNAAFLLSLFVWFAFMAAVLIMGAISITEWGGMKVWLIPIISIILFGVITKLKGGNGSSGLVK